MPIAGDRPYTATLSLAIERSAWTNGGSTRLNINSSVGVMGDEARGGELQNEVHSRLEGSSTAYGRDAQLRSMPIVQFGFERHYVV